MLPPGDRRDAVLVTLRGGLIAAFGGHVTETLRVHSPAFVERDEREREHEAPVATISIRDEQTERWTDAGLMHDARYDHTATLLADGRVLVAGGTTSSSEAVAAVELWDPTTQNIELVAPLARPRRGHAAVLLADGRLMVAGGTDAKGEALASVEIWDGRTWSIAAPLASARAAFTATALHDGRVVVIGGFGWRSRLHLSRPIGQIELWDPLRDRWTAAGALETPRGGHTARLVDDGTVQVGGGMFVRAELFGSVMHLTSTEIYDPAAASGASQTIHEDLPGCSCGAAVAPGHLIDDRWISERDGQIGRWEGRFYCAACGSVVCFAWPESGGRPAGPRIDADPSLVASTMATVEAAGSRPRSSEALLLHLRVLNDAGRGFLLAVPAVSTAATAILRQVELLGHVMVEPSPSVPARPPVVRAPDSPLVARCGHLGRAVVASANGRVNGKGGFVRDSRSRGQLLHGARLRVVGVRNGALIVELPEYARTMDKSGSLLVPPALVATP